MLNEKYRAAVLEEIAAEEEAPERTRPGEIEEARQRGVIRWVS